MTAGVVVTLVIYSTGGLWSKVGRLSSNTWRCYISNL